MDFGKKTAFVLGIAWRNVWKNKRRTALTMCTIMMGSGMIIFGRAFQDGAYEKMVEDVIAMNSGHVQVHSKGYWENQRIDFAFQPWSLISFCRQDDRIAGYSLRIHAAGLLSHGHSTQGAFFQAIDPVNEPSITNFNTRILKGGRFLTRDDNNEVVIGKTLAENLKIDVGGEMSLVSQGFDGSIAAEKLRVVGLFRTGNPEYDRGLVIMGLRMAESTFSMMGNYSSLAIRLKNTSDAESVRDDIAARFAKNELEVMIWDELNPDVVQHIMMDRASANVFYVILFLIVAFGVLNTIQMSVFERTRELGIMMAIGTRPGQIIGMVLAESAIIAFSGIILGVMLGSAIGYYFYVSPWDFSEYTKEMEQFSISTYEFPTRLTIYNLVSTSLATLVLSIVFSIVPALRASRLKPLEAIRHL